MLNTSRRGSAIVVVSIALVILLSLATVLTETTVTGLRSETQRKEDLMLMTASESAANLGLSYLQSHYTLLDQRKAAVPSQIDGTPNVIDGGDTDITSALSAQTINGRPVKVYWSYLGQRTVLKEVDAATGVSRFVVKPVGTVGATVQDTFLVTAIANTGRDAAGNVTDANRLRTRRIQMVFVPYPQNVFTKALFSQNGFDFMGAATTKSWSSTTGTFTGVSTHNGDIASEGDIDVLKPTNVDGTVTPFVSFPMPEVVYDPAGAGAINLGAITGSTVLNTGTYAVPTINIASPQVLTINGLVTLYVAGALSLESTGPIANRVVQYATAASRLTIIQNDYNASTGDTTINAKSVMGNPDSPSQFLFLTAYSGQLKFNGAGSFGGVLYAPNATIQMNGTFDLFGSVIAKTFGSTPLLGANEMGKINGNFTFIYDEVLGSLKLPLPPRLGVIGWYTQTPSL